MDLSIPAEWAIFVHRFKQAKNEKEKTDLLAGNSVDQIIDYVFKILRNERDEQLKITVLIFLEDNVELFFSDKQRMEKTCTILNNLIHLPNDSPIPISDHVKSQVVITLTTILVTLDTIKSQPRAFESFVEVLFEVVAKVNEPNDKLLRQTACESLKELELQYPGLLVAKIGNLFVLAQQERSHVHQSYHLLAVTVLRSLIQVVEEISVNSTKGSAASVTELATFLSQLLGMTSNSFASFSLFTSRTELNPFSLSAIVKHQTFERQVVELPCQPKQLLLEPLHAEVKKAIQYFVEISTILSPWAMIELSYSIIYLIQLTDLSRDLFKHQLSRLGMSFNSLLKHMMLIYSAVFYDIFQSQFEQFIVSLIHQVNNTINPTAERVLALEWLTYFPYESVLQVSHHDYLFPNHQSFLPTIFDVLQVREAKVEILRHCFKPKDPNTHIIKNILDLFVCFQDFIYHKKDDYLVLMVFRLVRDYLATFPNELFDQSYKYLSQAIERNPSFVGRVIKLLQSLEQTPLHHKLLQHFEREIVSLPVARVGNYLDLVHRISLDTDISPVNLLQTLHSFLRYTSTLKTGDWTTGNTLLEICKAVLVTHVNVSIFEPLHALLMFMAVFYSDIDIRDRAHFYDQLLIHLSNDKIKSLLTSSAANDLQEAGVDNLHRVRETNELSTKNFIMLHRLTPQHNHNCTVYLDNSTADQSHSTEIDADTKAGIIRAYKAIVAQQASRVTVDLPFIVTYKPRLDNDTPRTIYSVTVTFADSPLYHPIEPLHLPILASGEARDLEQEQFPYKYRVMVNLRPVLPIPTSFDTKITFNIAGGINCEDNIDALTVSFTDLLLPVTFDSDTVRCTASTARQVLFEQFWSERETSADTRGAISVKHINKSHEHVLARLANKFKPYLIDPSVSLTDLAVPAQVLGFIFLPPKYHLLLKFNVKPTHTLIELTTDYWFNLTFVDQYLDDLFAN